MTNNDTHPALQGYIIIKPRKRKFAYKFEDKCLTVYSCNSIPIHEKEDVDLNLNSNTEYLIANDLSTGKTILFFVDSIPFDDDGPIFWTSTSVKVYFYIILSTEIENFNITKASLSFEELNKFFPLRNGLKYEMCYDNRTVKLETISYEQTVEKFEFIAKGESIKSEVGIKQTISGDPQNPLKLTAILDCSFEKTQNIELLLDLYGTIKRLFCFLCRRKSVSISDINLLGDDEENKQINIGKLFVLFENAKTEDEKIIEKTVKFHLLKRKFPDLVQLISDDKLYFEHIPQSEEDSHHITVSSFILNAAAFEWTFEQCYGKIPVSPYRQEVKRDILSMLDALPEQKEYNSKKKGEVKLYSKIVSGVDRNFSEKILYALKDFDAVLSNFIKYIYRLNNMEFSKSTYAEIADDLQYQRNAYAHGDIDKEMKENIISDTIIMEWLNYCMVFKKIGYTDDEIFNLINSIFRMNGVERKIDDTDNQ